MASEFCCFFLPFLGYKEKGKEGWWLCKGSCNTCWLWYSPASLRITFWCSAALTSVCFSISLFPLCIPVPESYLSVWVPAWQLPSTACWMLNFCPLGLEKQQPKPKVLGFLLVLLSVGSRECSLVSSLVLTKNMNCFLFLWESSVQS